LFIQSRKENKWGKVIRSVDNDLSKTTGNWILRPFRFSLRRERRNCASFIVWSKN